MRIVAIMGAISGLAGAALMGGAQAQPNRIDSIQPPAAAAPGQFWTEQRLREARPMPVPVVDPRTGAAVAAGASEQRLSARPANEPPRPLAWTGKLFFAAPEGQRACTAQLVAPGILLTAAHCLQDEATGRWYTQFLYVNQYYGGQGRQFTTECAATYRGWLSRDASRWAWDFGMMKLRGGSDLGHFGWEHGWLGKHETAATVGTDGEVIAGKLVKGWHAKIVGLKHDRGASDGAGWIARWDTAESNPQASPVISLTSHHHADDSGTAYGPYWDDDFLALLNHAKSGCR